MLSIFAKSFMTAARTEARNHWGKHERFAERRRAELIAHTEGRRRV